MAVGNFFGNFFAGGSQSDKAVGLIIDQPFFLQGF